MKPSFTSTGLVHIAVVEDECKDRDLILSYIERFAAENCEMIRATHFENAASFLSGYNPIYDIVFLDIQMPGLDGMKAAERLRQIDAVVPLVFITNMSNFAVRGYSVNALDFVVKPVAYYNFSTMLARAIRVAKAKADEIVLKTSKGSLKVALDSISYIETEGHQVIYHTDKGEVRIWETLKQQESRLPANRFAKCSNYCLVNLKHIDGVRGNAISVGGVEITITRTQKQKFMQCLLDYYGDFF